MKWPRVEATPTDPQERQVIVKKLRTELLLLIRGSFQQIHKLAPEMFTALCLYKTLSASVGGQSDPDTDRVFVGALVVRREECGQNLQRY